VFIEQAGEEPEATNATSGIAAEKPKPVAAKPAVKKAEVKKPAVKKPDAKKNEEGSKKPKAVMAPRNDY